VKSDPQVNGRDNWTIGVPLRPRCDWEIGKGGSALSVDGAHHQRRGRHLPRRTTSDGRGDLIAISRGGHPCRPRMAKETAALLVSTILAVAACVDGDGDIRARVGGSGRLSNLRAPMRRGRGDQAVRMEAAVWAGGGAVAVGGWPVAATTTGCHAAHAVETSDDRLCTGWGRGTGESRPVAPPNSHSKDEVSG